MGLNMSDNWGLSDGSGLAYGVGGSQNGGSNYIYDVMSRIVHNVLTQIYHTTGAQFHLRSIGTVPGRTHQGTPLHPIWNPPNCFQHDFLHDAIRSEK